MNIMLLITLETYVLLELKINEYFALVFLVVYFLLRVTVGCYFLDTHIIFLLSHLCFVEMKE